MLSGSNATYGPNLQSNISLQQAKVFVAVASPVSAGHPLLLLLLKSWKPFHVGSICRPDDAGALVSHHSTPCAGPRSCPAIEILGLLRQYDWPLTGSRALM
jgi:hypothetical protein